MSGTINLIISSNSLGEQSIKAELSGSLKDVVLTSQKNLDEKVLPLILKGDPSIQKRIDKSGVFSWKIKIEGHKTTSTRLQRLVPFVCYPQDIENKLYNYQKAGVRWLLEKKQRILADDMGLGKTVQILIALQQKIYRDFSSLNLLLAPLTLIKNWEREVKIWAPNLVVTTISPETFKNEKSPKWVLTASNLILCPYSLSANLLAIIEENELSVHQLICDEAHKLRKGNSIVNNTVRRIKTESVWLISGTPLERDEDDIANILAILFPQKTFDKGGSSSVILRSNLRQATLRREKKEVLPDLPKVEKIIHILSLSPEQSAYYKEEIQKIFKLPSDQRISLITKLCIATCKTVSDQNTKIAKTLSIIEENKKRSEKTIIFSNFNEILMDCKRFLSSHQIASLIFTGELDRETRDRTLDSFKRNPDNNVLLLNSRIGGEGLTLTEANNVIFLNEWWNPSSNRQAEDRVNRIGQKRAINIHILRAKGTIDEDIARILANKSYLEKSFLEALVRSVNEQIV